MRASLLILQSMLLLYWRVAFVLVQRLGVRLPCRSLAGWSPIARLLAHYFADRLPRDRQRLFFQIRGTCIIYNIFLFQSKLKFEYVTLVNIS